MKDIDVIGFAHLPPGMASDFKTFVVLGPPRSGTSMIAGTLRILGVDMGPIRSKNHEDPRFRSSESLDNIRTLIRIRNVEQGVWGWKMPGAIKYISNVIEEVRSPIFIVSFRNPLAIARSKALRADGDFERTLFNSPNYYIRTAGLFRRHDLPRVYVNYEAALADGNAFVDFLCHSTGLTCEPEKRTHILDFIRPNYREI